MEGENDKKDKTIKEIEKNIKKLRDMFGRDGKKDDANDMDDEIARLVRYHPIEPVDKGILKIFTNQHRNAEECSINVEFKASPHDLRLILDKNNNIKTQNIRDVGNKNIKDLDLSRLSEDSLNVLSSILRDALKQTKEYIHDYTKKFNDKLNFLARVERKTDIDSYPHQTDKCELKDWLKTLERVLKSLPSVDRYADIGGAHQDNTPLYSNGMRGWNKAALEGGTKAIESSNRNEVLYGYTKDDQRRNFCVSKRISNNKQSDQKSPYQGNIISKKATKGMSDKEKLRAVEGRYLSSPGINAEKLKSKRDEKQNKSFR